MRAILIALMILAGSITGASAHHRHHQHAHHYLAQGNLRTAQLYMLWAQSKHVGGRPRAWCGFWMRQNVGRDPGPAFNLARNWAHWGEPAGGPSPGVIGVMAHHVFKVIQVTGPGRVLAISGNDGHAVRTRERSTSGVIAWRRA